ncbi:hypothetical protein GCM10008967_39910 [Bacillus carboniphilus]|uniref:Permease n=1 Tax=Bacillus carboniphilus TaxID=86663 RepID=A0ABP3GHY3_9BACI
MGKQQTEMYDKIQSVQDQLTQLQIDYWFQYSHLGTWQFWVLLLFFFVGPLVTLYFVIDRRIMFFLGFYGFNIHVWFGYIDTIGRKYNFWGYPYELIPFIPGSIALDATLVPISFMLVYQWTLKNNKNYYLYTAILAAFFSFIIKPILTLHHLFELHRGVNFFHLFLLYCIIFLISKIITNIFIKLHATELTEERGQKEL